MSDITLIGAVKAAGAGFEGWASTSQLDRQGDVVLPQAFAKSLDAFRANGPIFWNHAEVHDPLAKPIGRATDASIREGGLYIKGRWASTPEAQEVRSLVTDGIVSTMSIGYNPVGGGYMKAGTHVVDDLELMEVSIVAIPANPGAVIIAAKRLAVMPSETKGEPDDDVSVGATVLSLLAQLMDEEGDDPADAAILQRAIDAVLEWLGTEVAEIGTEPGEAYELPQADGTEDAGGGAEMERQTEAAPIFLSHRVASIKRSKP